MLVLYGCRHPGLLSPNEFCRFKGTIGWKFQMSMKNAGPGCRADQTSGTGRLTIRGCRSSVAGTPFRQRSIRDSRRSGHGRKTAVPPVERGGKTFQFIIYHCSGQNTRRKKEKNHPRLGMGRSASRFLGAGSPRPPRQDFRGAGPAGNAPGSSGPVFFSRKPPRSRKKRVSAVDY